MIDATEETLERFFDAPVTDPKACVEAFRTTGDLLMISKDDFKKIKQKLKAILRVNRLFDYLEAGFLEALYQHLTLHNPTAMSLLWPTLKKFPLLLELGRKVDMPEGGIREYFKTNERTPLLFKKKSDDVATTSANQYVEPKQLSLFTLFFIRMTLNVKPHNTRIKAVTQLNIDTCLQRLNAFEEKGTALMHECAQLIFYECDTDSIAKDTNGVEHPYNFHESALQYLRTGTKLPPMTKAPIKIKERQEHEQPVVVVLADSTKEGAAPPAAIVPGAVAGTEAAAAATAGQQAATGDAAAAAAGQPAAQAAAAPAQAAVVVVDESLFANVFQAKSMTVYRDFLPDERGDSLETLPSPFFFLHPILFLLQWLVRTSIPAPMRKKILRFLSLLHHPYHTPTATRLIHLLRIQDAMPSTNTPQRSIMLFSSPYLTLSLPEDEKGAGGSRKLKIPKLTTDFTPEASIYESREIALIPFYPWGFCFYNDSHKFIRPNSVPTAADHIPQHLVDMHLAQHPPPASMDFLSLLPPAAPTNRPNLLVCSSVLMFLCLIGGIRIVKRDNTVFHINEAGEIVFHGDIEQLRKFIPPPPPSEEVTLMAVKKAIAADSGRSRDDDDDELIPSGLPQFGFSKRVRQPTTASASASSSSSSSSSSSCSTSPASSASASASSSQPATATLQSFLASTSESALPPIPKVPPADPSVYRASFEPADNIVIRSGPPQHQTSTSIAASIDFSSISTTDTITVHRDHKMFATDYSIGMSIASYRPSIYLCVENPTRAPRKSSNIVSIIDIHHVPPFEAPERHEDGYAMRPDLHAQSVIHAQKLLDHQAWRFYAITLLITPNAFQVFCACRAKGKITVYFDSLQPFSDPECRATFTWLMRQPPSFFGYLPHCEVEHLSFRFGAMLGYGRHSFIVTATMEEAGPEEEKHEKMRLKQAAEEQSAPQDSLVTAMVRAGRLEARQSRPLIVKVYDGVELADMLKDAEMLQLLTEKEVPRVPKLVFVSKHARLIVTQPVGRPWPFNSAHLGRHFFSLIDTLQHMHRHRIVHRNIRPSHIVLVRQGSIDEDVCLVDMGSAGLMEEPYFTTQPLSYASDRVLMLMQDEKKGITSYTAADDLESLTKSFFSMATLGFKSKVDSISLRETSRWAQEVLEEWKVMEQSTFWNQMIGRARAGDYSMMKALLLDNKQDIVPW